jgi:hypothetical protein
MEPHGASIANSFSRQGGKMKTVKKNLKLIAPSTETSDSQKTSSTPQLDVNTQVLKEEKMDIYEVTQRRERDREQEEGKPVDKDQLVNKINYINFRDDTLLINLKHRNYRKTLTLFVRPQPCLGDLLDCLWPEEEDILQILKFYEFKNILIPDGQKLIMVEPEVIRMDKETISLLLPHNGYEISSRKAMRHLCTNIKAQLIQSSSLFSGALLDFNAGSFKIELKSAPPQTFEWINPESPVSLILSDAKETYYTGECKIIRQTTAQNTGTYILKPLKREIQRFKHKEFRSHRYELTPSPNIIFRHPFTKKIFDLKAIDLSGSGFSVEEDEHNAVLLPGLILPKLELSFANSFRFQCRAQVVYQKVGDTDAGGRRIKCGLALLDMDIQDHVELVALLDQAKDKNSYICSKVNLDELWDFFFDTGFIYPDKYAFIQKNKDKIKRTYERLYSNNPHIARHFIYQDKGRILGHMAMIRFYESTWLIQHHASRKSSHNKAGLVVLDQIGRMLNDSNRLYSLHMDYVICYYRPSNKFPSRIFGGAAKSINNQKECSIDQFAYYHYQNTSRHMTALPKGWEFSATRSDDLQELEDFYEHISGGLMLEALDMQADKFGRDSLAAQYHRAGLTRERHFYSLKKNGNLKAIITAVISDVGLNLSDLTNCIKVFALDPKGLASDVINTISSFLSQKFQQKEMAILLYPAAYADEQRIVYEKLYNLWVCRVKSSDEYFRYLNRLLRFI